MMKKIKIFSILSSIFAFIFVLASCNGNNITGSMNITTKRTSIDAYAEFDVNDGVSSSAPYINLYTLSSDGAESYSTQKTLSFQNNIYTQTTTVSFTNLKEDTEYTLKLFITKDNKAYEIDNQKIKTTPTGSTEEDPIMINTYEELMDMDSDTSAYYKLATNIDCQGSTIESLFTSSSKFTGSFDGNNKTISNFVLPSNTYMGLFAYASAATIKDLTIDTVSLASGLSSSGRGETYLGVLAGRADNTTITNVKIINVDFDITFYSTASVSLGAFVGRLNDSTVTDCSVKGADINVIRARRQISIGLFTGFLEGKTTVTNCFSDGIIKTVTNYSNTTGVNDYCFIGGFAGVSGSRGLVSKSYSKATITVSDDSSKSSVSETHELSVGGFIGRNMQGIFNVNDCAAIADINVTSIHSLKAFVGGLVGNATNSACELKNVVYVPLSTGINVNYKEEEDPADVEASDDTTTQLPDTSESDTSSSDTEDKEEEKVIAITVSLAIASNTTIKSSNVYVVCEKLLVDMTNTTIVSGNYALYSKVDHEANFSDVIKNAIEAYLNI